MTRLSMKKGVEFVREELERIAPDYQLLADCIAGERAVKGMVDNDISGHLGSSIYSMPRALYSGGNVINAAAARRYLPQPQALDASEENAARYDAYVTRAVFYNATSRTLDGYLGQLFQRPPVVELPDGLDAVAEDTTGERVNLVQLMKETVSYVLPFGRSGVFADYPMVRGGLTRAQRESGMIRPILRTYAPWNITNWRERQFGSARILELVVLREQYTVVGPDGFEMETHWQYRELALSADGFYGSRIWRQKKNSGEYEVYRDWVFPVDARGQKFRSIPFFFVGSGNNDPKLDRPPFLDIAKVNIGHYRNSADYEESCFMVGQPTPVFAGMTQEWHEEVLGGQIFLGSRASVSLPEGGTAMLLQPNANTMPVEAMKHKEKQMITLGARIAEQPDVMRTATEATIAAVETHSPLLSTALNVGTAYVDALKVCAAFAGVDAGDSIKIEISSEATLQLLSTAERQQMREDFAAGILTFEEVRHNLRRSGVTTVTDEEARKHYDETLSRREKQSMTANKETTDAETEAQ
jgi:hypothetical protein